MDEPMSIAQAMALSARENRIVHLQYGATLEMDLHAECDDSATNGDVQEFWGADWRIHLHS